MLRVTAVGPDAESALAAIAELLTGVAEEAAGAASGGPRTGRG